MKRILIIFIIIGLISAFALAPLQIMGEMTNRHCYFEIYEPELFRVNAEKISLKTADNLNLVAWNVEASKPKGTVIFVSGIYNPSVTYFFGHAKMMQDNGFSSLLIELRSHGESDGDKIGLGMLEYKDVEAGVNYIKSKKGYEDLPIIVFGVSMGGATAINSIGELSEIDGLISLSAYSSWTDVVCDNMVGIGIPKFISVLEKPFIWLYLGFDYGFDKLNINPKNEIKKLNGRPALLMHSTTDSQVPYESFERLKNATKDNIETFIREGNYHFIVYDDYGSEPWNDTEYANKIIDFLNTNFS